MCLPWKNIQPFLCSGWGGNEQRGTILYGCIYPAPRWINKVVFAQICPWSVCSQPYWGNWVRQCFVFFPISPLPPYKQGCRAKFITSSLWEFSGSGSIRWKLFNVIHRVSCECKIETINCLFYQNKNNIWMERKLLTGKRENICSWFLMRVFCCRSAGPHCQERGKWPSGNLRRRREHGCLDAIAVPTEINGNWSPLQCLVQGQAPS